ncbi:hydroxymethylglutaryl-CoA lyase [Allokutzneria sp. A3M-2-11 16]|uniref:hydroxymethylglutaryl-CoA lyase n=1 Tax=Allokutzneria sp. A3M-2-11 16 TaxID=2962043 RepID=UPI0020B7E0ED|nr:hydroxymethylglutaryl-CoA lyase [Allokutzneria sp. A3M-2-11 16]MCP3800490.1 hydroxymethylglutaryl-CoA lyase [Allokutzneria sp. A3M-2-11 16]
MRSVELIEVGPRDGLQNESRLLSTVDKIELIECCVAAGLRRIEAVSFARPEKVPQLADAEDVMASVPRVPGVSYAGLVLNRKGLYRALAAGVDEVNVVVATTEEFSRRNLGVGVEDALRSWTEIAAEAASTGVRTTVTLAAAFGCPFSGDVAVEEVIGIARRIAEARPDEISLADTIGVGTPDQVRRLANGVRAVAPGVPLRGHFHNTRNTGYANALAALDCGVATLDVTVGGIGGCPYTPSPQGNVATEDVLYALDRMGVRTGVDVNAVLDISAWLSERLGREVPALLGRAGTFPPTT